jgi:predicted enzyme related to lactoylglutathione lyase
MSRRPPPRGDDEPVDISYLFASLAVSDRDESAAWYERLLGRPPDFLPNDAEAVWQLAATASFYVAVDSARPERAGQGVLMLVVEDLDSCLAEIAGRQIALGEIEQIGQVGRRCPVTDPDGNVISITQISQ